MRKLRHENDRRESKVIDREEAVFEVSEMFSYLRDRLRALPDAAAVEVPQELKPLVLAVLRRGIEVALQELASRRDTLFR